jgi:hypothetical protein
MSDLNPSIEHVDVLVVGGGPVGIDHPAVCTQILSNMSRSHNGLPIGAQSSSLDPQDQNH